MKNDRPLARFTTEGSHRIEVPVEQVMDRIVTTSARPGWQPEILSVQGPERLEAGAVVDGTAQMLGFRVEGRSRVLEAASGVYEEDVVVGVRMRVRYEIDGASSTIHQRLVASLPAGPAGSILSFFLKRGLRKMQRQSLEGLADSARG